MQSNKSSFRWMVLASVSLTLLVTATAMAQTEKILHDFNDNGDGFSPFAGLVFDKAGNLYGTTFAGGTSDFGTVFEMVPNAHGGWNERLIHSFTANGVDGYDPIGNLILDEAGNLYGTTHYGGPYAGGTVFEFVRQPSGSFTERILHSFGHGKDGIFPETGLVFDAQGNLYGATFNGGSFGVGMVYELIPKATGGWMEKILYSFSKYDGSGGGSPYGGVIFDATGNLYGTTSGLSGGAAGGVFKLTPTVSGLWTLSVLHQFTSNTTDGAVPYAGLVMDASGNLYGTTWEGGDRDIGSVFELSPGAGGTWTETILHSFQSGSDGCYPQYGSLLYSGGNLYGTTTECGPSGGGIVFEMSPAAGGSWTETALYAFLAHSTDGVSPQGGLLMDASGNLYGTTEYGGTGQNGGSGGAGTVFEITP